MEFKKGDKVLVEGEICGVDTEENASLPYSIDFGLTSTWVVVKKVRKFQDELKPQGNCKHWEGVNCGSCVAEHCRHKPGMNIPVSMWENCPFQETRKEAPGVWDDIKRQLANDDINYGRNAFVNFIQNKLKEKGHDIR